LAFRIVIDSSQIVCRDIWALHLSTIPHTISPEPLLHKQDGEPEPSSAIKRFSERELVHSERFQGVEDEGSDSESVASSSSEVEDEDPELEALLEQLSASSEDDDPDLSSAPTKQTQTTRKARGVHELPANNLSPFEILGGE
jgi:RNA polymerase I-specific transcription initiation factor RRN7